MIFLLLRINLFVAVGKWKFLFRQRLKILSVKISFHGDNYRSEIASISSFTKIVRNFSSDRIVIG